MDCSNHTSDFVAYLRSDDNDELYSHVNTYSHFICELPKRVRLSACEGKVWTGAITDLLILDASSGYSYSLPQSAVILCSIAEPSIIKSFYRPVLRQFWTGEGGEQPNLGEITYVPVSEHSFQRIIFDVLDHHLKPLNLATWKSRALRETAKIVISLTLHFQLAAL